MKNETKLELIKAIDWELKNCDESGIYPNLCGIKKTEGGLTRIQEQVIVLVADEGMRIDSALAQLESTM